MQRLLRLEPQRCRQPSPASEKRQAVSLAQQEVVLRAEDRIRDVQQASSNPLDSAAVLKLAPDVARLIIPHQKMPLICTVFCSHLIPSCKLRRCWNRYRAASAIGGANPCDQWSLMTPYPYLIHQLAPIGQSTTFSPRNQAGRKNTLSVDRYSTRSLQRSSSRPL